MASWFVFYGAEDFVRAERSFRHTIALDSSHSPGHQNLGNTLINVLKNLEEAIEILEKGSELDSSSTHSLWNLSLAYLLGRFKEGWRYYEARFNCPDFRGCDSRRHLSVLRFRVYVMKPPNFVRIPLVVWTEQGNGRCYSVFAGICYLAGGAAIYLHFVFSYPALLSLALVREWTLALAIGSSRSALLTSCRKNKGSHA